MQVNDPVVKGMTLRWLQANLPWTIPYSDMFVASAYSMDRVAHDVMHVMKSLGRIAAECEGHDHGRDRKLYGEAFAKEVADLVICALHIAKLEGFDLQDAVIDNSSLRNKVDIQALAALAHEQKGDWRNATISLVKRAEAEEDRVRGMRAALERSKVALDDWLHVYAGDMCDPQKVAESVARISEAGATLAYIAKVQKQNRAALAQSVAAYPELPSLPSAGVWPNTSADWKERP